MLRKVRHMPVIWQSQSSFKVSNLIKYKISYNSLSRNTEIHQTRSHSLCQTKFRNKNLSVIRNDILERKHDVSVHNILARNFHTSQKREIHPIFWIIIKPAGKVASIITGRSLRKWWQKLSSTDKTKVKEKLIYHRLKIVALIGLAITAGILNFATHIQETPITKRRRYIAFTEEQFLKIAKYELENQWEALKEHVIDPKEPKAKKAYGHIVKVAQRIVDSNQHLDLLKRQKWNVILVDSDLANAFVLPTGQIFVYRGILELTENIDQLAVVIGHEIAHVILNHGAEKVSMAGLLDVLVILLMAGIWFFMPSDGIAIVTQWFNHKVMTLLLSLPYSRKLEAEADLVGLQLIARACFDVREASTFWQKMAFNEELVAKGEIPAPEWTSTHPSSDKRAVLLNELVPQAIDMRESNKCARLSKVDPRFRFKLLKSIIETEMAAVESEEAVSKEKADVDSKTEVDTKAEADTKADDTNNAVKPALKQTST